MLHKNLKDFIRGWFIGNFEPTLFQTDDFEVGIKKYKKGDYEKFHTHKVATELTVIIEGKVEMNGTKYFKDDVIVIKPGEGTDFRALTKVTNLVVKIPCVKGDKYVSDFSQR